MSDPVTNGRDALESLVRLSVVRRQDRRRAPRRGVGAVEPRLELALAASVRCCSGRPGLRLRCCWPAWCICWFAPSCGESAARRRESEEEPAGGADRVESLPLPVDGRHLDLLAEARRCRQQGDYGRAIVFLFGHNCCSSTSTGASAWPGARPIASTCGRSAPGRRSAGWSSKRRWLSRTCSSAITRSNDPRSRLAGRGWRSSTTLVESGERSSESGDGESIE